MAINLNAQGNCASDSKGTGLSACTKEYGDLLGIDLYPKGYSIDIETGSYPTESEYVDLITSRGVYPLNNLYDFSQDTPDNDIATSSTGIKKQIRSGKPEYSLTWSDGGCFHTAIYDKKGYNLWDIVFKFESGVLYTYNASETQLKAFAAGMFDVATYKFQQGTDPDMTVANFQLTQVNEMNLRQNFVTWEELGYDQTEQNGILDVNVEYTSDPADASTDFSVQVTSKCNSSVVIESLTEVSSWSLGGTQASPTTISAIVYNSSTQSLDFTLDVALASGDIIQPSTTNANGDDVATDSAGNHYSGSASLFTVA